MGMCIEIRLNDDEYYRYRYRPKLLSHQLYNTTDLAFILAKVNNIVSDKDFDFRVLKVVHPDLIDQLFRIYQEEKKYLRSIDLRNVLSIDEFYYSEEGRLSDELDKIEAAKDRVESGSNGGSDSGSGTGGGSGGDSGSGTGGGSGSGINDDMYNEILIIIKNLQDEIDNINSTIVEILEKLIKDDLEDIINELIENKLNEKLDDLIARIEDLEGRIPEILEGQLKDIMGKIEEIFDRLAKLEEGDLSGAGIKTRDVVIRMNGKFELGVDLDTEFRIPYKGNIIKSTIAINVASKRKSNIIFILQMYDEITHDWYDTSIMDLQADTMYDTFTINKRIDGTYVRIYIKSGDVDLLEGVSVILTVLEDSVAEAMGDKELE